MKFVTAIYNELHHSPYGGRLNRNNHYLFSLKCLAGMGEPILCYTSSVDKAEIEEYLFKNTITNVSLEVFELNSMKYHDAIHQLKHVNKEIYALDNIWTNRCVELMWLKIFWLEIEAIKYPNDKIFWIDAGISHNGILPKRFKSNPIDTVEQSHQHDLIFTHKLVDKLDKLSDNNLFTFYCSNRQHSYPELYSKTQTLPGSIVAGLFGGTYSSINFLKDGFDNIVNYILSKNTLLPEELIFTLVYQKYPDKFEIYEFDTWYHEDWDCFESTMKPFSTFFEDVL
jgi:hypothetical protein